MTSEDIRRLFESGFEAALAAVEPAAVTARALDALQLDPPVTLLALGKAGPAMARGASDALGGAVRAGLVVSDHEEPVPDPLRLIVGGHPVADRRSVAAGRGLLGAAEGATEGTLLVLVSGGGSALADVPLPGLTLDDMAATHEALLRSGAPIHDVNTVRRHLSSLKNGGLRRTARVPVVTLLISDVVDASPESIASGPTLADATTPRDALEVVRRYRLDLPAPVIAELGRDLEPVAGGPHRWEVIADGATAAGAAAAHIEGNGMTARVLTTSLGGPAAETARRMVVGAEPGRVHIAAGETTVEVSGDGVGGRNQHAALAAAIEIEGREVVFAAFGTDGRDGPTDAAGAIVDGGSAGRMRQVGIDPPESLGRCNSHPALQAAGDLVITGPTGTNVADLWFVWRR